MGYNRTRGSVIGSEGLGIGAKGTEKIVIDSNGNILNSSGSTMLSASGDFLGSIQSIDRLVSCGNIASGTSAATETMLAPCAGVVTAVYQVTSSATSEVTMSLKKGATVIATADVTADAGVSSAITLSATPANLVVAAGNVLTFERGALAQAGISRIIVVIARTA